MALTKNEFWIVTLIALVVSLTFGVVLYNMSMMRDGNAFHQSVIDRLTQIEQQRVPATARRFTADHGLVMIACEKGPEGLKEACLDKLEADLSKKK